MPNLANITVKKADGTTDIVYTGVVPSSGDKTSAVWKALTIGATPGVRPQFSVLAESNQNGTARRIKFAGLWPSSVVDANGRPVVMDKNTLSGSFSVAQNMTDAEISEFAHQFTGLLASVLFRECLTSGYSPR